MAKELPYFQFEPAEYLTKDISFCSLSAQGLFINICAYYWQRQCKLTKEQFLRRFNYEKEFNELLNEGVIDLSGNEEFILIKFLDIQFSKATKFSAEQSRKGSLGGRPRKPNKSQTKAEQKPNKSQTKAIREDNIREDNIREDNIIIPEIENFGSVAIEDFNFSHSKILKFESPSWLESVSMQQKIPIEEIQNKIDDFVLFLKTTETQHKNKKAFLEHFINWLTKKNNSEKNGKQQVNASSGKKPYRFDLETAIAEQTSNSSP